MEPTGMPCAKCGRKDDEVNLIAELVHGFEDYYILLICESCIKKMQNRKDKNKRIELKYNYKIPVYIPEGKKMEIKVIELQKLTEVEQK